MTTFAELTTLRVGGPIANLVTVSTDDEIATVVADADRAGQDCLVVGSGSNLLCGDGVFAGTVLRIASRGMEIDPDGDHVRVEVAAGEPWDEFVEFAVAQGWAGIEALSGIPGLVGATPIQNVGAYGQEIGDVIADVSAFDRRTQEITTLRPSELGLAYRSSRLKENPDRYVVTHVALTLRRRGGSAVGYSELADALGVAIGEPADPQAIRDAVLELRRGKAMVLDPADHDTWSAGSFFTNPVVDEAIVAALPDACRRWPTPQGVKLSAAWLIEQAGVGKGYRVRPASPAAVSGRHSLALTNRGGATAADILELAMAITEQVEAAFGIRLEPEPRYVNL